MTNTIQLTIMFTQYVPCSSKWIELAGGVLNTDFVYDEEKIANSAEVFLSLKDTDVPTCLDIELINPSDGKKIARFSRRLSSYTQDVVITPQGLVLWYGTVKEYVLKMIDENNRMVNV